MKFVVLTGSIASGKTTVSSILARKGNFVIDCDKIAKRQAEKGHIAYLMIVLFFGAKILDENNRIDRQKLGSIIFNDESKRKLLNKITHPWVKIGIVLSILRAIISMKSIVIIDIPLYYETNMNKSILFKFMPVILVTVSENIQKDRLKDRNGFTDEEAMARIRSQLPASVKRNLCDYIIDNDSTIAELEIQVDKVIDLL